MPMMPCSPTEGCSIPEKVGLAKSFTWTDIIEKHVKSSEVKRELFELYNAEKNMPFHEFLKSDALNADELQIDLKFRILAIQKTKKYLKLLFDGRHSPNVPASLPIKFFEFDQKGNCQVCDSLKLPKLHFHNFSNFNQQEPLWKLLGLSTEKSD